MKSIKAVVGAALIVALVSACATVPTYPMRDGTPADIEGGAFVGYRYYQEGQLLQRNTVENVLLTYDETAGMVASSKRSMRIGGVLMIPGTVFLTLGLVANLFEAYGAGIGFSLVSLGFYGASMPFFMRSERQLAGAVSVYNGIVAFE